MRYAKTLQNANVLKHLQNMLKIGGCYVENKTFLQHFYVHRVTMGRQRI